MDDEPGFGFGLHPQRLKSPLTDRLQRFTRDAGHFGLKTMRDRIEELSGIFTIESERGSGTAIAVSLPIEENNDD